MITILKTERLILRPFDESDAESVYEYAKDGRVGPIAGWRAHTSVENSREIIRTVLAVPETYAVCLKEDNKAIGAVGLMVGGNSNIKMNDNEGEIGYWLGVPFWGQGLMPEAVRELIRHAFADLELKKLWCGYFDGNEKSRRCQEKCGFTYHHTEKDIYWALMNDIRTEHITCLTKEQWESGIVVRPLAEKEVQAALDLSWEVFLQFEAPEYSQEGIDAFRASLDDRERCKKLKFYGAFDGETLAGTICMRAPQHIGGFFVKAEYHRKGIGRALFERMRKDYEKQEFTVNSSPYAVGVYEHLGFTPTDKEQVVDGLRFTPMIFRDIKENIVSALTAKDDNYACALADRIVSESRETDEWYCCFDEFAKLLSHPKSLVRNRAFSILAANAQWDGENRFDKYIDEFLSHVTDEKPISARQCIKALAQVGKDKPQYIPQILSALENADLSKYRDSMRPLIEKDISETKERILN